MDNNNWRPTQGGGEQAMDAWGDWRSQLHADSRQRIVNKIMDTLKRHLPFSGQEGLQEVEKIAVRFEEKIYTDATNQSDYLRTISLKMLTMETKNPMPNAMQSNSANNGQNSPDPDLMDNNNWRPTQGGGMHQRLQTPGTLLQQQNVIDQQKQVFQPQGAMPEASSNLMDNNNWRPTQGGGEPAMDAGGDWRRQQQAYSRQRIVNKMLLQQQQQQQQMMSLRNNLPHMHQQQLGSQGSVGGLQQQQQQQQQHQLLGAQSGTSVMPNNQHSVHMLQQSKVPLQQSQQSMLNMLPSQGQQTQQQSQQQMMSNLLSNQSQSQQQSQQMMSQIQSQPGQLQKQLGLQQQHNPLQRDMQQRLQTPGTLLQQQNVIDQQKQVFQHQGAMPEASSTSLDSTAQTRNANGGDWQEEIYQKIKSMKDMYFLDLNDMYHKIAAKLHQIEPLLQQQPHLQQGKKLQLEKLKAYKSMVERFISLLQVSKSNIQIGYKDKLGSYEKQIMSFLKSNRPRKPIPQMQQGQALPPPHMHSLQRTQTPQSQLTQLQPLENQMNLKMQSLSLQGSVGTMHQKTMGMLE